MDDSTQLPSGGASGFSGIPAAIPPVSPVDPIPAAGPVKESFNPSIHAQNADGSPRYQRDGVTLARKRGRRPGEAGGGASVGPAQAQGVDPEADSLKRESSAAAFASIFCAASRGIGGPDCEATADEWQEIKGHFNQYFMAAGTIDMPPSVALAMGLSGFWLKRLDKPSVQSRIKSIAGKFKRKESPSDRGDYVPFNPDEAIAKDRAAKG